MNARWLWLQRGNQMTAWCDHPGNKFCELPNSAIFTNPDSRRYLDWQVGKLPIIELLDAFKVQQRVAIVERDDPRTAIELWPTANLYRPSLTSASPATPRWIRDGDRLVAA